MFKLYKCNIRRRIVLSCSYSYLFHQVSLSDLLWLHYPVLCCCQLQLPHCFRNCQKTFPSNPPPVTSPSSVYVRVCVCPSLSLYACLSVKTTQVDTQAGSCAFGCVKMKSGQTASSSMSTARLMCLNFIVL